MKAIHSQSGQEASQQRQDRALCLNPNHKPHEQLRYHQGQVTCGCGQLGCSVLFHGGVGEVADYCRQQEATNACAGAATVRLCNNVTSATD